MGIFEALLLGVVQGITEFVPVSSSGHLILVRELFGITTNADLTFDVLLHFATALAVVVYFWRDIVALLRHPHKHRVLWWALVLGTIPAVVVGVFFEDVIVEYARGTDVVLLMLLLGSLLFLVAEWFGTHAAHAAQLTPAKGFWMGCYQALALIPGISRSGAAISGGLLFGLSREQATRFAFLLSFPVLFGVGILKGTALETSAVPATFTVSILAGGLVAFLVGILAIHFMIEFLRTHSLIPFAIYRFLIALIFFFLL